MKTYKELMEEAYGEEGNRSSLLPREGIAVPSALLFFDVLEAMYGNYLFTSDIEYHYQSVDGYGWMAWGMLYIAIPEFETYERHEGKWACTETLIEAVQQTQHDAWRQEQERREFTSDMDNYLSQL